MLDWCVKEFLHFGKGHDLVKLAVDLCLLHPEDSAVKIDVLATGKLRVETRAHFQERPHPTKDVSLTLSRSRNSR